MRLTSWRFPHTALSKRPEAEALDKIRYESITDPDKIEARSVGTAPR